MAELSLKCRCGAVGGVATEISPAGGNRVVCYCDDCQSFARHLGREDDVLNEYGGTDIFQITPSQVRIGAGAPHIRCLRLTAKGLYRWYTDCCNTPIGNTPSAGMPIVGMIHAFFEHGIRDAEFGPVRAHIQTRSAREGLPAGLGSRGFPPGLIIGTAARLAVWKMKGRQRPSPFFDVNGKPVSEPRILG